MKLILDSRTRRIYLADDGVTTHEQRAQMRTFHAPIERATYVSLDPADKEIVEKTYRRLRADLAAWFATHDELEIGGEPMYNAEPRAHVRLPGWPGGVPGMEISVAQVFWEPAPKEES